MFIKNMPDKILIFLILMSLLISRQLIYTQPKTLKAIKINYLINIFKKNFKIILIIKFNYILKVLIICYKVKYLIT